MKVEIGLAYSKKPIRIVAWIINLLQKVNASHVYMAYHSVNALMSKRYLDSTGHSTRIRGPYYFNKDYDVTRAYYCDIPNGEEFLRWVEAGLGKPYSHAQVIGLFLKLLGLSDRNLFRGKPNYLICNELAIEFAVRFLGVQLDRDINDYDLDETKEILDALVESGKMYRGAI